MSEQKKDNLVIVINRATVKSYAAWSLIAVVLAFIVGGVVAAFHTLWVLAVIAPLIIVVVIKTSQKQ